MLILTRKLDESIIINDNIEIKIVAIGEGKIKVGIDAPRDVVIHRKEVYEEIERQNKEAATSSMDISSINRLFINNNEL